LSVIFPDCSTGTSGRRATQVGAVAQRDTTTMSPRPRGRPAGSARDAAPPTRSMTGRTAAAVRGGLRWTRAGSGTGSEALAGAAGARARPGKARRTHRLRRATHCTAMACADRARPGNSRRRSGAAPSAASRAAHPAAPSTVTGSVRFRHPETLLGPGRGGAKAHGGVFTPRCASSSPSATPNTRRSGLRLGPRGDDRRAPRRPLGLLVEVGDVLLVAGVPREWSPSIRSAPPARRASPTWSTCTTAPPPVPSSRQLVAD
jgi:hypothetical protein